MNARILNVDDVSYFNDPSDRPSLTQSIAKTLITKSPLHAWTEHPRFGGVKRVPTDDMDEGTILDLLLLSGGDGIEIIDAPDYRTKDARALRDAAKESRRTPILRHKLAGFETAANAVRENLAKAGIELTGESQLAIEWTEDSTHGEITCRSRLDHVFVDRGVIYDLKKIRSAHPKVCSSQAYDLGYDIQRAAYVNALYRLRPELVGRVDFVFLFCEIEPPYSVTPARMGGAFRDLGERRWRRAIDMWAWCTSRNKWPSYCDAIINLEAPHWAIARELEEAS